MSSDGSHRSRRRGRKPYSSHSASVPVPPHVSQVTIAFHDSSGVHSYVQDRLSSLNPFPVPFGGGKPRHVNVRLVGYDDADHASSALPVHWHRAAYAHLYLLSSEDKSIEYKRLKVALGAWVNERKDKKQEWYIVNVANGAGDSGLKMWARPTFARVKSDFDQARCIELKRDASSGTSPAAIGGGGAGGVGEQWTTFRDKLTKSIATTSEKIIGDYKEEVNHLGASRKIPGWNYCQYFVVREGLAFSYSVAGQLADALKQYDRLEDLFHHMNRSTPRPIDHFGVKPGDDNMDSFGMSNGERGIAYRNKIYQNDISELEFRSYVFSRQCGLLMRLGLIQEVAERSLEFVKDMRVALEERVDHLPSLFSEAWTISVCEGIVASLDDFMSQSALSHREVSALLGDLTHVSRRALSKMGKALGYVRDVPSIIPIPDGDETLSSGDEGGGTSSLQRILPSASNLSLSTPVFALTNPVLAEAIAGKDQFDHLFIMLSSKASGFYADAERPKMSDAIKREVGDLYLARERYEEAEVRYKLLCMMYVTTGVNGGWRDIVHSLRTKMAHCQRALGNERREEYALTCLGLLTPLYGSARAEVHMHERVYYQRELVRLVTGGDGLRSVILSPAENDVSPVMSAMVEVIQHDIHVGQTLRLRCTVKSMLPDKMDFERLTLEFSERVSPLVSSDSFDLMDGHSTESQVMAVTKSPALVMRQCDVCVHPGTNVIEISQVITESISLVCYRLTLELGGLKLIFNLNHSKTQAYYERNYVTVSSTIPSGRLSLDAPPCVIINQPTLYMFELNTMEDEHVSTTITFKATPGLEVKPLAPAGCTARMPLEHSSKVASDGGDEGGEGPLMPSGDEEKEEDPKEVVAHKKEDGGGSDEEEVADRGNQRNEDEEDGEDTYKDVSLECRVNSEGEICFSNVKPRTIINVPLNLRTYGEDTDAIHQLSIDMSFINPNGEELHSGTSAMVEFVVPFRTSCRASACGDVWFVQVMIASRLPTPVVMRACELSHALGSAEKDSSFTIQRSHVEGACGVTLVKGQHTSVVFVLSMNRHHKQTPATGLFHEQDATLSLHYSLCPSKPKGKEKIAHQHSGDAPGGDASSLLPHSGVMRFDTSIRLSFHPSIFRIDVECPRDTIVGAPTPIRFSVRCVDVHRAWAAFPKGTLSIETVVSDDWMLVGPRHTTLALPAVCGGGDNTRDAVHHAEDGGGDGGGVEIAAFPSQIVAFLPGYLPSPQIAIVGIAHTYVENKSANVQIYAYPEHEAVVYCNSTSE